MTHNVRLRIDPTTVPSDATTRVETWADQYRPILRDQETTYAMRTDIDGRDKYGEAEVRFDIRDDLSAIVNDLVAAFDDVGGWQLIETKQDDQEWEVSTYADDATYYSPDRTDGHRTPPSVSRSGLFEVTVSDVNYLVGGTEYAVAGDTLSVPESEGAPRKDFVVVDETETLDLRTDTDRQSLADTEVVVGELETHPGKVTVIDTASVGVMTSDWSVDHNVGDVPAPLTGGDDPSLAISGDATVINDGTDEATIDVTTDAVAPHSAELTVDGSTFVVDLDPAAAHTETITSTANAGYVIDVDVSGPWPTESDSHEIEVVSA